MIFTLVLFLAAAPPKTPQPSTPKTVQAPQRKTNSRTVEVTDSTATTELFVAAGTPCTLTFPIDVKGEQVFLVDPNNAFFPIQALGRTVIVVPKKDIPPGQKVSVTVTLSDGTLLPPFILSSSATEVDLTVEVRVSLKAKATSDSTTGLKTQVSELQSRLDECQQSAADSGAGKVAALILKQDMSKPGAFLVERHPSRNLDKQSRLLVETLVVYRLFGLSYLVLTVENRDPTKAWVLDRPEIVVAGANGSTDARVTSVASDLVSIPSGEVSKYVIAFTTPTQETGQTFRVKLLEKDGARHVSLDGIHL